MIDFFKTWGVLIVAVLALIQPWAIAAWKRFFRRGIIDIYKTGTVEVGYSSFGATIGLHGTLRAVHRDQFVNNISVQIIRIKDNATHRFEWTAFRAQRLTTSGQEEGWIELPAGFMVMTTQPHRYNILFSDIAVRDEMQTALQQFRMAWFTTLLDPTNRSLLELSQKIEQLSIPPLPEDSELSLRNVYAEFSKTIPFLNAYNVTDRMFYWEPGRYKLEMKVTTARPERSFTRVWMFELSQAEADSLRQNVLRILGEVCYQPYGQYNFAYVRYEDNG